jgi:tricorn protease-like protein
MAERTRKPRRETVRLLGGGSKADAIRRSAVALARRQFVALENPDILPAHIRRTLDRCIWEYTKADGKYKTRWRSRGALGVSDKSRLTHEHVVPRKILVDRMLDHPERVADIMAQALGCVVTREEHKRLTDVTRANPSLQGWDRYETAGVAVVDTWERS